MFYNNIFRDTTETCPLTFQGCGVLGTLNQVVKGVLGIRLRLILPFANDGLFRSPGLCGDMLDVVPLEGRFDRNKYKSQEKYFYKDSHLSLPEELSFVNNKPSGKTWLPRINREKLFKCISNFSFCLLHSFSFKRCFSPSRAACR